MKILKSENYIIKQMDKLRLSDYWLWLIFSPIAGLAVRYVGNRTTEWHPVRMGWFTSSYCSCRSSIG